MSTDQVALAYGGALIAGGLMGFFRRGSLISLVSGLTLGSWSIYNATNPTRHTAVANLAIAAALAAFMLLRYFKSGKWFPALLIVAFSGVIVFRNYSYLK